MANQQLHEGHRQRLRDRAFGEGLDRFNAHQLLELLLFYAIPRQDTNELAHALTNRFGTIQKVLTAPVEELLEVKGMGERSARWLHIVGELMESYAALRPEDRPRIVNFQSAFDYCRLWGKLYRGPQSFLLCLTPDGAILSFSHLCDSTDWAQPEILIRALGDVLSVRARSAIVVQIEQGEPVIGEQDIRQAERFSLVLRAMGAELLDVICVGEDRQVSLNRSGCLDRDRFGEALSVLSEHYLREDVDLLNYEDELPMYDNGL